MPSLVSKGMVQTPASSEFARLIQPAWSLIQMSRFIESAVLDIPLGQVVTYGPPRLTKSLLIDGYRRITAVSLFAGVSPPWEHLPCPNFALTGTELEPALNGMTFKDIQRDDTLESRFLNATLTTKRILAVPGLDLSMIRSRAQG